VLVSELVLPDDSGLHLLVEARIRHPGSRVSPHRRREFDAAVAAVNEARCFRILRKPVDPRRCARPSRRPWRAPTPPTTAWRAGGGGAPSNGPPRPRDRPPGISLVAAGPEATSSRATGCRASRSAARDTGREGARRGGRRGAEGLSRLYRGPSWGLRRARDGALEVLARAARLGVRRSYGSTITLSPSRAAAASNAFAASASGSVGDHRPQVHAPAAARAMARGRLLHPPTMTSVSPCGARSTP